MARACLGYVDEAGRHHDCPGRRLIEGGPRCDDCRRRRERARRPSPSQRGYDRSWQAQSDEAIAAHVELHGWVCLGAPGHPAHLSTDLVLDHIVNGDRRRTQVMCRGLNTAKRNAERGRRDQGGGLDT